MNIGEKIKEARIKSKMTLEQLAKKTEVSVGFLSQIEREKSSPTLNRLLKITEALDINITQLFGQNYSADPEYLTLRNHRKYDSDSISVVHKGERKKILLEQGIFWELLAPVHNKNIEFILISYPIGAKHEEYYTHEGEECGIILEGTLKCITKNRKFILNTGDSISFNSSIPHRWENAGDCEVKAIWAISPPSL